MPAWRDETAESLQQCVNSVLDNKYYTNCYLCLCNEGAGSHEIKSGDANDTFWIVDSLKLQHLTGNWNSWVHLQGSISTHLISIEDTERRVNSFI